VLLKFPLKILEKRVRIATLSSGFNPASRLLPPGTSDRHTGARVPYQPNTPSWVGFTPTQAQIQLYFWNTFHRLHWQQMAF